MKRVITSTGGMIGRPNGRDYTLLKGTLPQIRADGVEFMLYSTWYDQIDRLADCLVSIPVHYTGLHVEKSIGEFITMGNYEEADRLFGINLELAKALRCEHLVLHLWNGPLSDSNIQNNYTYYGHIKDMAENAGFHISVENVVCSCQDPIVHMKNLLRLYPDIEFTYDTKMAHFHGQIDTFYSEECAELWPHITHLHVNDRRGAQGDFTALRTLHIGEGEVDFDKYFAFLRAVGFDGDLVCEAVTWDENGVIHPERMNKTLAYIREHI